MLHHMATILVCYGGHFESKMATKIQKSSDLGKIWFQCVRQTFGRRKKERRIIIITRVAIAKQLRTSPHPMAPNSKNDDDYQFARARSTWKPNFALKIQKLKRFQWKWIFTGSKTCCTIWRLFWFAMDSKWPPKYKNPPIWAKFGFQVIYNSTKFHEILSSSS
jgi:hypothetical protein